MVHKQASCRGLKGHTNLDIHFLSGWSCCCCYRCRSGVTVRHYIFKYIKYLSIYLGSLLKWRGKFAWLTTPATELAAELQRCPKQDAKVYGRAWWRQDGVGRDQTRSCLTPALGRQGQCHQVHCSLAHICKSLVEFWPWLKITRETEGKDIFPQRSGLEVGNSRVHLWIDPWWGELFWNSSTNTCLCFWANVWHTQVTKRRYCWG